MLIAEEYALLARAEDTGKLKISAPHMRLALCGALLIELVLRERISVTPHDLPWRERDRIELLLETSTEDRILDLALIEAAKQVGHKPKDVILKWNNGRIGKLLVEEVMSRLVASGVVGRERHTLMGVINVEHFPEVDPAPEREIRQRVDAALVGGAPSTRTAILISLLSATDLLTKIVSDETDKRAARRRAKEIAAQEWAGRAVKDAIAQISASVGAAAVIAANA
ncbi:MAG: GPP34 family phosphoprotein [Dermatophilaceae bacterium]